jgi:putative hydroxymethylpyrimidine transport system substrate-binding protein
VGLLLVVGLSVAVALTLLLRGERALRVTLDFFPNPNHVPLYVASENGLFDDRGVRVELIVPGNPSDPVKLAAARRTDVALTPQINYLIARSEGLPLIAIGALIGRGLGGLLGLPEEGIGQLSDLKGRRIGYSLAPLEPVLWQTMLACVGVGIDEVELINVGYNTVVSLITGGVDAIGAFRNFEPIQVALRGYETVFFPQEEYCIPDTMDIVLVAHRDLVAERPDALRAILDAVAEAIEFTREDPEAAFSLFLKANPDLDDELNRRAFDATLALYASGARHDDEVLWREMQRYLVEQGLVEAEPLVESLWTVALLPDR